MMIAFGAHLRSVVRAASLRGDRPWHVPQKSSNQSWHVVQVLKQQCKLIDENAFGDLGHCSVECYAKRAERQTSKIAQDYPVFGFNC